MQSCMCIYTHINVFIYTYISICLYVMRLYAFVVFESYIATVLCFEEINEPKPKAHADS